MMKLPNPVICGILSGLFVFLLGFGAMNVYWLYYATAFSNASLPTLYDFYAATIGDGIFLPMLTGSATTYIVSRERLTDKAKEYAILTGIGFALIGFIVQISWLVSNNTGLNWTIPELHKFNMAGWHHALFFSLMFFIVGNVLVKVIFCRVKDKKQTSLCEDLSYALFWASGIGFLFMWVLDDYADRWDYFVVITIFLLVVYSITILSSLQSKSKNYRRYALLLSCHTVVYGIAVMLYSVDTYNIDYYLNGFDYIYIVIISVSTLSFINPSDLKIKDIITQAFFIIVPTTILLYVLFIQNQQDNIQFCISLLIVILIATTSISIYLKNKKADRFIIWGILLLLLEIGIIYIQDIFKTNYQELLNAIANFATGTVVYFM